jgi:hypothetical protein
MPVKFLARRSPLVLALAAYDIWRRLPPQQRQQILDGARKHGPRLASAAVMKTRAHRGLVGRRPKRKPKPKP